MGDPPVGARPRVAIVLASIGGWVDAIGFLTLFGLFTAHLSGNTARLGVELGRGDAAAALTYAVPITVFFGAVAIGALFVAARRGGRAGAGRWRRWSRSRPSSSRCSWGSGR